MTNLLRKHAGAVMLLAVLPGFRSVAFSQTSVIVEIRVLELSRTDQEAMGGTSAKSGFAKPLTKSLMESLAAGPKSRVVHRIELPATSESATQVRLDSRITVSSSSSADVQTFFDAGIVMDVTPKVYQNRDISLATASQVRIRRGPDAAGTSPVVFENPLAKFDTRIHEGESILLGGFITAAERMTLPEMPMLPDNPILNYLYPKVWNPQDRTEIAILLTPRIVGPVINPAVDAPVIVSKPAVVNPSAPSLTAPAASSLAAAPSPTGITSQSAITSALPGASTAAAASAPVVTSPPVVASPAAAEIKPSVPDSSPVVASMAASTPSKSGSTAAAAVSRPSLVNPPVSPNIPAAADANLTELGGIGGRYTVQVGAFDQLEKAEMLRAQLAKTYDMVFVEKVGTSKTPYRVRVGRFPDMQSARKVEKQLAGDGIDTYVTTLN
jgi:cell division septation protein DedD